MALAMQHLYVLVGNVAGAATHSITCEDADLQMA